MKQRTIADSSHRLTIPPILRALLSIPVVLLLVLIGAQPAAAESNQPPIRNILVLFVTEHQRTDFIDVLNSDLQSHAAPKFQLFEAYLGLDLAVAGPNYTDSLAETLRQRFAKGKLDLVIAVGPAALKFGLQYRDKIFPGAPILFTDLGTREFAGKSWPGVTGLTVPVGLGETLDLALQLQPDTENVALIASADDSFWLAAMRSEISRRSQVREIDLLDDSPSLVLEKLAALPPHTIAMMNRLFPGTGDRGDADLGLLNPLTQRVPTYSAWHNLCIDHGCIGGAYEDKTKEIAWVAETAARLLSGTKPEEIPIHQSVDLQAQVDWRQFQRWGLSERRLPSGVILLQKPPALWEAYKGYVVGALIIIALQTLLIASFIVQRHARRRAEAERDQNQKRLAGLFDTALDAIIAVDEEQRIVLFNASAERIFGCPVASAIGSSLDRFVPQRFRAAHSAHIRRFGETGKTNRVMGALDTLSGLRSTGEEFPIEASISQVETSGKKLYTVIIRDATERRQAEAESRRLNRALQTIVECRQRMAQARDELAMLTDVCQVLVDLGGYRMAWVGFAENDEAKSIRPVVYAGHNEGFSEMLKLTWADSERGHGPTGTAVRTGQPSIGWDFANDPRMAPWRDEALRRGFVSSISLPLLQDGRAFGALTLYSSQQEAFDDNEIRLLTELTNDVAYGIQALRTRADREKTAQELEKSEARFRTIFESSGMGIALMDLTGHALQTNPAFQDMIGYSETELLGVAFTDLTHPDHREHDSRIFRDLLEGKAQSKYEMEKRYIRKDGQIVWAHLTVSLVKDGQGQPQYTVAMIQDITERKQVVEALRDSEAQLREAEHIAGLGSSAWDVKTDTTTWSAEMYRIFGWDPSQPGPTHADRGSIYTPESWKRMSAAVEKALATGEPYDLEVQFLRRDGAIRWGYARGRTMFDDAGRVIRLHGTLQDITERKRAEGALRDSEAQLREAEHIAGVGSWVWDVITDTTLWSPELYRILGFDSSQPPPKVADQSGIYTPDSWARLSSAVEQALTAREPYDLEVEFVRGDGTVRWGQDRGTPVCDNTGRVVRLSGTLQDITDRKRAQEALLRLRQAVDASGEVVFMTDREGVLTFVNPQFTKLYEYSEEEVIGKKRRDILKDDHVSEADYEGFWHAALTKGSAHGEIVNKTKSGRKISVERSASAVRDEHGDIIGFISIQRDVTRKKYLEQQLMQAQKMEAVGRLAGGVAHDFNNILGIITGYTELTLEDPTLAERSKARLGEIRNAANRAVGITRQLLAFSRKQVFETRILNLNMVVQETTRMLGRLLGEDIEITLVLDPNLGAVSADPTGIDQIILNLAVNARDAMPNGGKLTIQTANATIDADSSTRHGTLTAGDYVVLTVSDTGVGMDAETQERIFEPFYTTKEKGRGTGLGLSTVFGIVEQSGGSIWTYSEVGCGTTFKIYLPRAAAAGPNVTSETPEVIQHGGETILLVEDDSGLRKLNGELLRDLGYNVVEAIDGAEALRIIERYPDQLHLLLTDVIMPGMNGQQLAEEALRLRPTLKVLFVSGYTDSAVGEKITASGAAFLQKPLSRKVLANTLREILDSNDTGAGRVAAARRDA